MTQRTTTDYLVGNRYRLLKKIGEGGMGSVFQAEDRLTGQIIALKRLKVRSAATANDTDQRETFAREFQILAALRHPHIISVLDFGYDTDQRPYFTMPLLEAPQTILEAAAAHEMPQKMCLLTETLQALVYLHRHGILHRDLKPNNILVEPNGRLRVLDFGIAAELEHITNTSGTLEYMAPEVLSGAPARLHSDLYALGVIAYQMFAGRHPFQSEGISRLIHKVLHETPDRNALNAPRAICEIVLRLLEKTPEARYPTAYDAMLAFYAAINAAPSETPILRESVLQSPKFVGRTQELTLFEEALANALNGKGSAWLISGESGVGKTRLLDEIRIRALVKGALVVRWQCSEGVGDIYNLWREMLRRLVLFIPIQDNEARLLKAFVPDLERLIGRTVAESNSLTDEIQLSTLLITLVERVKQPIVLIIDDVHWSSDSLLPLRQLTKAVARLSLIVIAAYRTDDDQYFYGKLPEMQLIKLARFSADEVRALTASVIGSDERFAEINDFLVEHTEGNAFYVIEALRTLAQTAGSLEHIRQAALPAQLFSEGMLLVARRRLARLKGKYQTLVQIAAVIGREIDFNLLEHVGGKADYDDWLIKCVDVALVHIKDGKWYFTHDKIREGVLQSLSAAERQHWHRAVAESIEALYPNQPDYDFVLALHWRAADDLSREMQYLFTYVPRAIESGSAAAVREHLEITLQRASQAAFLDARLICLHMLLGQCHEQSAASVQAEQHFLEAYSLALTLENIAAQAEALYHIGRVKRIQSNFRAAQETLQNALQLYQQLGDASGTAKTLNTLGYMYQLQAALDLAEQHYQAALQIAQHSQDLTAFADAQLGLGYVAYYRKDIPAAEHHTRLALEHLSTTNERLLSYCLSRLSLILLEKEYYEEALVMAEQSIAISQRLGDAQNMLTTIGNTGYVLAQQGRYAECRPYFERSIALAQEMNNLNSLANRLAALAQVDVHLGDWEAVRRSLYEWLQIAFAIDNVRGLLHGFYGLCDLALHENNAAQAAEWIGVIEAKAMPDHLDPNELARLRALCTAALGEAATEESIAYGRTLDLNTLAQTLLSDVEGIFARLITHREA